MRTIGKIDKVDLPEFSLENIPSKIDTGADTSAIHCTRIVEVIENSETHLSFWILDDVPHKVYKYETKTIKNSFGQKEKRYLIETYIYLFNKKYKFTATLSDRSDMKFPILIGKRLLNKKFLVDVSKINLSYKNKIKNKINENKNLI